MAALSSKRCAASRGTISIKKTPQIDISKENEAKKKNSLMWGVGLKMATQDIFPPPPWLL
jgi:hypothetical protein